jgi:IMP dehydrogenase
MKIHEALTFDDVILVPQYSEILPTDVDVSTQLSPRIPLRIPIISAAMDTVTETAMAIAMDHAGGLGIIHKNMSPQDQAAQVRSVKESGAMVGAAIGIGDDGKERANGLVQAGVDALVVDTAHGHSRLVLDCVLWLKDQHPKCTIIAGNIATGEAAIALADAGVDAVKVGIGPGSICTTRIVAGIGMPQLTAIMTVADALAGRSVSIIADGGIRYSGDITKALAAGAHCVMLGNLLAATLETPGDTFTHNGMVYKTYRGMGSLGAIVKGSDDRYFQHKRQGKFIAEGIEGALPVKGTVDEVLHQLVGGLTLGLGYTGSATIPELHKKAQFMKITAAGIRESHVGIMDLVKETPNYKRTGSW